MTHRYPGLAALFVMILFCSSACAIDDAQKVGLNIEASRAGDDIDLTRYSLGQGGLSDRPMIDAHVDQLKQLHPPTIRLFVQEYFNLLPEHGRYHWDTLDKTIEAILATGAKPIMCLCMKPKVFFPKIDHELVHPTSYDDWDELIFRLVQHCNQDRKFGIEYWEIGNEGDIGESGGCPYKFKPDDYVVYYSHTAKAILKADPHAKVGGPALAGYQSPIGDALIEHAASGKSRLDFFSWHMYDNNPQRFRKSIKDIKAKLPKHSSLKNVETLLDEWNMSLSRPVLNPFFQPAFVLETTLGFLEEGLTRAAYYHIRDFFVDPKEFAPFMSRQGTAFMAHWWNVMPQYDGLYDNQGRVRPAYYSFKLLSLIKGKRLAVSGTTSEVKALAAVNEGRINLIVWNFPTDGKGKKIEAALQFSSIKDTNFRMVRLNPESAVNNLEVERYGPVAELQSRPLRMALAPYEIYWVEIGP